MFLGIVIYLRVSTAEYAAVSLSNKAMTRFSIPAPANDFTAFTKGPTPPGTLKPKSIKA